MNLELAAQLITAAATFAAVLVALFGRQIAHLFIWPQLRITMANPAGIGGGRRIGEGEGAPLVPAWYYHLRVANPQRTVPVRSVRVFLLSVLDLRSNHEWEGEAELQWRYAQPAPDMGFARDCDLCVVVQGVLLLVPVQSWHLDDRSREHGPGAHLRLSLQARGLEGDSPVTWFDLKWEGARPEAVAITKASPSSKPPAG